MGWDVPTLMTHHTAVGVRLFFRADVGAFFRHIQLGTDVGIRAHMNSFVFYFCLRESWLCFKTHPRIFVRTPK